MIEEVEDKEDAKTPEPKSDIKNCLGFSKPSPKKQAADPPLKIEELSKS